MAVTAAYSGPPKIIRIDSLTPTKPVLAKPGTKLGETFVFEETHPADTLVKIGVLEAGAGRSVLRNFPFTEYVLMISGSVVVTE